MASKTEQRKVEIIAQGTKVNATIKEMGAAVSLLNNQLNKLTPGSDAFVKKSNEFKAVKQRLQEVNKEAKGLEKTNVDLVEQFAQFVPFGGTLLNIRNKFREATGGVGGMIKGLFSLKGAIISTGIGALVVLLGTMINYLLGVQSGMDKVTAVTRPLNAIFEKMKGVVQELGGSVFNGLAMILNGDLKAGLEVLSNGFKDAFTNAGQAIRDGWEAGTRLDQLTKQIERREIEFTTKRAELAREYKESMEVAENVAASADQRRAAANRGIEVTNERLRLEQELLDMKIEKMELEQSLNDTSREQELELAQLRAQRIEFETQASEARTTARSKLNTVNQQIEGEDKKRHEDRMKREALERKKIIEDRERLMKAQLELQRNLEDMRIEVMEDGYDKELARLEVAHGRKMQQMEQNKEQVLMNEQITEEERLALLASFREQQDLAEEEYRLEKKELEEERRVEDFEKELERLTEEENIKAQLIEEQFLKTMMSEQERDLALLDLERSTLEARLNMLRENGQLTEAEALSIKNRILAIEKEKQDAIVAEEKKRQERVQQLRQTGLDTARQYVEFHADLIRFDTQKRVDALDNRLEMLKADEEYQWRHKDEIVRLEAEKEKVQREANRKLKNIERGRIIASGIEEVANIWKSTSILPFPANTIAGGIQTAIAAGRTILALRKLESVKYAGGGFTGPGLWVSGSGHLIDSFGEKVSGVVHHNEWVMPRFMTEDPKYANVLGWLESERTRRFAEGGGTSPGVVPAAADQGAPTDAMMKMFAQFLNRIDSWPRQLKVVNDPRDIQDGIAAVNEVDMNSDIS